MIITLKTKIMVMVFCAIAMFAVGYMLWFTPKSSYQSNRDYYKLVVNPDKDKIIKRIIPNHINKNKQGIKVYNQYELAITLLNNHKSILIDAEPRNKNSPKNFDLIITTKQDLISNPNCIYVPAWSLIIGESSKYSVPDLLKRYNYPKSKFCAYMYSNCDQSYNNIKNRETFFTLLNHQKGVDALGKCKHNVSQPYTRGYSNWLDYAIETYKPYKFVIAFENTLGVNGYVSEKLILPLLAGCIPIYYGDSLSAKIQFNTDCFINVADFENFDECIKHVLKVDADDALYQKYVTSSIISKEKLIGYAGWYYGTKTFYDKIYKVFPNLLRIPYVPIKRAPVKTNSTSVIKIINLDKSVKRWNDVQKQLEPFPHLKYERFPAVDGKKYMDDYKSYISTWDQRELWARELWAGEIGIYLSTMELFTVLTQDVQNDYYMVLEDDVIILRNFDSVSSIVEEAPDDWDMIFIGRNRKHCVYESTGTYTRLSQKCMPGNFAYIIRKRAAQYLLNFAFPIERPIDEMYRMHCDNLNIYILEKQIFEVDYHNESTINFTTVHKLRNIIGNINK